MRELQLCASFSRVAPNELWTPVPTRVKESFELEPRVKSRAAAAITIVMAKQEGQNESNCEDRLLDEGCHP